MKMKTKVLFSGPALADVFLQCFSANGFSEGLMFGQVEEQCTSQVTDMAANTIENETSFYVSHLVPCAQKKFYDGAGNVVEDQLEELCQLNGERGAILGCFSCRVSKSSPLVGLSMRQKAVHRSLLARSVSGHCLTLSMTGSVEPSAHGVAYCCYLLQGSLWEKVPVNVLAASGGATYRQRSESAACRVPGGFRQLVNNHDQAVTTASTESLLKLNEEILKSLEIWGSRVTDAEAEVLALEEEVRQLEEQLKVKRQSHESLPESSESRNSAPLIDVPKPSTDVGQPSSTKSVPVDDLLSLPETQPSGSQTDMFNPGGDPTSEWKPYVASMNQAELDEQENDVTEEVTSLQTNGQTLVMRSTPDPESPLVISIDKTHAHQESPPPSEDEASQPVRRTRTGVSKVPKKEEPFDFLNDIVHKEVQSQRNDDSPSY